MSIVVDSPYRSTRGRKPSRPAFAYEFHNDAVGGTSVVDRFGNAAPLALQGTLGTAWTASRGFWRPNGTDAHALPGDGYGALNVVADGLLTQGRGLLVAWRFGWIGSKGSTTECVLCIGRSHSSSALVQFNNNNTGLLNVVMRGLGASSTTGATFGSSGLYVADKIYSGAIYIEPTADGFNALGFLDGANVGTLQSFSWLANSGSVPPVSTFSAPDGLTVGAQRAGSNPASPTWAQRVGATSGGGAGTIISNLRVINLEQANVSLAADLALEFHQYPRAFGEILAGV